MVEAAEQRDDDDAEVLQQLQELEEQVELIERAAAQIAEEEGLGPQAQEALRAKMLSRVQAQAQALRAEMVGAGAARPGVGSVDMMIARSSPRAAGQNTAEAWRSNGGPTNYGAFRLEHHHGAIVPSDGAQRQEPHPQARSNVVFGGTPAGLYPHSSSMVRGKFPGY